MSNFYLTKQAILAHTGARLDEGLQGGIEKRSATLEDVLARFHKAREQINDDPDLSTVGKRKRTQEAAVEANQELQAVEQAATGYDGNIAQLEEQLRPKSNDGQNDVVRLLEEQEIRRHLAGLDPLEVVTLYQEAGRTGNDRLVSAVEHAPAPFGLVQPEVIDEARQERAERANPEVAQRIADLRLARDSVHDLVQAGRGELKEHGLHSTDQVAAESASGTEEQADSQ